MRHLDKQKASVDLPINAVVLNPTITINHECIEINADREIVSDELESLDPGLYLCIHALPSKEHFVFQLNTRMLSDGLCLVDPASYGFLAPDGAQKKLKIKLTSTSLQTRGGPEMVTDRRRMDLTSKSYEMYIHYAYLPMKCYPGKELTLYKRDMSLLMDMFSVHVIGFDLYYNLSYDECKWLEAECLKFFTTITNSRFMGVHVREYCYQSDFLKKGFSGGILDKLGELLKLTVQDWLDECIVTDREVSYADGVITVKYEDNITHQKAKA